MPTQLPGGVVRLDVNDPKDVQVLVNSGLAWRSGPKDLQTIMHFIVDGEVTRRPDKEPPDVRNYLDKVAPTGEPESPAEDAGEPGEEQPEVPQPEEAEPMEEPNEAEDMNAPGT